MAAVVAPAAVSLAGNKRLRATRLTSTRSFLHTIFVRKSWPKLLAFVLLVWTAVDISLPMVVCNSEGQLLLNRGAGLVLSSSAPSTPRQGGSQQSRYAYEDDCFCCCSHIVPTQHFELLAMLRAVPTNFIPTNGEARGIAESVYHPPRS